MLLNERLIARQRQIIADLQQGGHDITEAKRLLENLEAVRREHLSGCDEVRTEIPPEG